jgi:MFS family permease
MTGPAMSDSAKAGEAARSPEFIILFLVMLITGAGNTALQSVLPAIGRTMQIPDSVIATVFSVSALIWIFSAPYWAKRSDRQGRKKMLLVGTGGFTVSIALVGIWLYVGLSGLVNPYIAVAAIIFSRLIFGTFGSAAPPAAQAMLVLKTPVKDRTKVLSMLSSAFGVGTILGLSIAPWLVLPVVGLAGPAFVFALLGGIIWILASRLLSEDDQGDVEAKGANVSYPSLGGAPAGATVTAATSPTVTDELKLTDPRIWPWMLAGVILGHAQAMTGAAMGFLIIDRLRLVAQAIETQQAIGLALMCGAGSALLVQWGLIPILNLKPKVMLIVGIIIAALGLIANAYATSLYGIASSYALASAGFGFTRPAYTAGSSLAVGRRLQGMVAGRVTSVNGSSFVLGPTIGVGLYELDGALPFILSAIVLIGFIPYVLKKLPGEAQG